MQDGERLRDELRYDLREDLLVVRTLEDAHPVLGELPRCVEDPGQGRPVVDGEVCPELAEAAPVAERDGPGHRDDITTPYRARVLQGERARPVFAGEDPPP